MIDVNKFETKEALFAHLKANKAMLVAEKKSAIKHADAIHVVGKSLEFYHDDAVSKAETVNASADGVIKVTSVINTTNILDSHGDVHIPGLWKKSLKEMRQHWLIKEHNFNFDNVISDAVEASTRNIDWASLGFPQWEGKTQALVFVSDIAQTDKTGMYERYKAGKVPNHSVGMRYVKIEMAINSEATGLEEEKAVWDKYIDEVVNKEDAIDLGYFWAVLEAKVVEGSAVLRGSNYVTPTLSVKGEDEPEQSTHTEEPPQKALPRESIFARSAKYVK